MALRIKRGTNAERLAYTPELGELIYVTDYDTQGVAPLWVGDNSTVGGNAVGSAGGGGSGITELSEDTTPELGGNLSLATYQINGIGDIDITGTITASSSVTAASLSASIGEIDVIRGTLDGDVQGSVFSDDSTLMVDGTNASINTNKLFSPDNRIDFHSTDAATAAIYEMQGLDEQSTHKLLRGSAADISGDTNIIYGGIYFGRDDSAGETTSALMLGYEDKLVWAVDENGVFPEQQHLIFDSAGRLSIGTFTATAALTVAGDAHISGEIQAGSIKGTVVADDSTILIDGVAGQVLLNATSAGPIITNSPQTGQVLAWNGTEWTNQNNAGGGGGGSGSVTIGVGADDSALRIINPGESFLILGGTSITTASDAEGNITITGPSNVSELTNDSGFLTTVAFGDVTGTPTTVAGYGITDAITTSDVGAFTFTGSTIDTSDSSLITVTPAATFNSDVTVENDLTVTNKITTNTLEVTNLVTAAGAGTPELESDTSLLLTAVDRVEVTQSPLKMASFTTAERDALTSENGDTIYNTTTNKFQGYANGVWVDLH